MHAIFWFENLKGREHSEDLSTNGRIILKCILRKYGGNVWTGFIWLRIGTVAGSFEHGNEPSGSIKGRELLD
jgi:hypothetical protein